MSSLKCTYCGGTDFFEGPSGGMSTNVMCAKCRHWFNHTPLLGQLDDLGRVEPTDQERAEKRIKTQLAKSMEQVTVYNEGIHIRKSGMNALACLTDKTYGNYGAAASNLIRLAGYIDGEKL